MTDNFRAVNEALRQGDMKKAVRLTVDDVIASLKEHITYNQKQLIRMAPNLRRIEYYTLLKVAAQKLTDYAHAMEEEAKKAAGIKP